MPKPLVWKHGEIKTPPFSARARRKAGFLLRRLQEGETIETPNSKPLTTIGAGCHELRIRDQGHNWRIIYAVTEWAIVILEVFDKQQQRTPQYVIDNCKRRLAEYRRVTGETKD
ncbi:MAG: type II toxin-antitoxin system RelE/ParE family toxin [Deltaproteobacteria bacterium]|nr:MAG: type II toxin-antitoxin system RelE/ParE family toxin [Deltaproteobacteria bacterium]